MTAEATQAGDSATPAPAADVGGSSTTSGVRPSILRQRQFAAFFVAASISNAAGWMQLVAVPALLFDLTHQASWLGLSTLAGMVPAVLLTPWAGVLSDRADRRRILIGTQSVAMAATSLLWVLFATNHLTPLTIVAVGFVNGIATGFQTPTWQAFVPSLVPNEDMLEAVRLNSTQFTVARVLGPAFAGIVVATFGVGAAIGLNAVTYLLVIGVLIVIRPNQQLLDAAPGSLRAFLDGARHVWHHRGVRLAVSLALFTALTGQSLQYVASAIASDGFGRKSTESASLLTSLGVGALLASLVAGRLARHWSRSWMVVSALVMYVAAPLIVISTHSFRIAMVGFFVGGLAHFTFAVQVNSLIQIETPDQLRGRALSFYLLAILSGIAVGPLIIGTSIDTIGVRATLGADAVLIAFVAAWVIAGGRLRLFDPERSAGSGLSG